MKEHILLHDRSPVVCVCGGGGGGDPKYLYIRESVCGGVVGVCVYKYVFLAMRFVMLYRYRAATWHGGRGRAHKVWEHIFEVNPSKVKGQRSSGGQSALEMPYGNQIWSEEPLTRVKCIAGVEGHAGVNQRSNCLGMPYGHQIC